MPKKDEAPEAYVEARGCNRSPFSPVRVPSSLMFPIESRTREDGRVLKRYRLFHPTEGSICEEDPLDIVPQYELTEICPMELPTTLLLNLDYRYGKHPDELDEPIGPEDK
jgi:hypothetical protein